LKGGIALVVEIAPEADLRIMADQRKLKQVMFNLLSNAIKFTPTGGTVCVSCVKERDSLVITVADSGMGVRKEDIPKLFQPFTQLESVYTKKYEGTGLGLALTRRLVELHGGRIWVKSTFGTGSRFSFTIPLTQAAPGEPPAGRSDIVPFAGSVVLLIEDELLTLSAMGTALQNRGYRVLGASTGEEGVEKTLRYSPDLIILDLMLPGMNGFDVADRLRNETASAHVPILVVTAMDLSDADRARLAGMVWGIEQKGCLATEEFINMVEQALGDSKTVVPGESHDATQDTDR
jgi:CheY-like chemotaxis protein